MQLKFYTNENEDIKATVVERFNRSLKTKMHRYFRAKNNSRYVDILPDMLHSYNNTYHRSIAMSPQKRTVVRAHRLYPPKPKSYKWKYDLGDRMRITMLRHVTSAICQRLSGSIVARNFRGLCPFVHDARDIQTERQCR